MSANPRATVALLVKEISKFGTVGIIGIIIDVGLFNLFLLTGMWPSISKTCSMSAAMVFTYFGNKHWSFNRSTAVTPVKSSAAANSRQFVLFIIVNLIALSFSLIALYVEHEILNIRSLLADNIAANVIGLGLGTVFRFWAYRTFVFPRREDETPQEETVRERQIFSPEI